jgi:hypothetical protein
MRLEADTAQARGAEEAMGQPIGYLDGLSNADRENRFYGCYYRPASDDGGHVSVHGLARIFVRRHHLQIFTSNTHPATTSILAIDPHLTSRGRRGRLTAALWPGSRRQARRAGPDPGANSEP